ncbi:uncharacterized protein L203_101914 [Cryptococcus depauperatus CBS 7841]|uniref:F-box domain-containing protein n=1 Tax=Cryptococcus depauperatus CBS 7841 TaxID=1295531 RepID=A0A1E3IH75_9TREE|nr:hypothetical protein L203_03158 [Cryptococcus depauperatus CBS 7841]
MSPTLTDVPSEILLEYFLPLLPLQDIACLSQVNRYFYALTLDPTFWKLKTTSDFSFSPASHPPFPSPGWWRRVYLGLLGPRAFIWGSSDNCRLGGAERDVNTRNFSRFIDEPAEIKWSNSQERTRSGSLTNSFSHPLRSQAEIKANNRAKESLGVVELQAGGWCFAARCSDGSVWVWGQLDGTIIRFRAPTWEDKHCQCREPTMIPLPCKAEALSAGRSHLLILDSDNLIWELTSWGKAYYHTAPALTSPLNHGTTHRPHHIAQISAGWNHSAALTSGGDIFVWFPFAESYEAALTPDNELHGSARSTTADDGENEEEETPRGLRWGQVKSEVVIELPSLSSRPNWEGNPPDNEGSGAEGKSGKTWEQLEDEWNAYESVRTTEEISESQKVIKIASGLDFLIALRKNGEVWYTKVHTGEAFSWLYLPYFSSPAITHITAQFQSITTYATPTQLSSSSSVYHARLNQDVSLTSSNPNLLLYRPDALPALQNKEIIQVAIGDYHYAALTSNGRMYTWGQGSTGQLGTGYVGKSHHDPAIPQPVEFPKTEDHETPFVFAITAAGWHTGALVLGSLRQENGKNDTKNMKIGVGDDKQQIKGETLGRLSSEDDHPSLPHQTVRVGAGILPFRIGFPGRGMFRGIRDGHAQTSREEWSEAEVEANPNAQERPETQNYPQEDGPGQQRNQSHLPTPTHRVSPRGIRAMPFFRVGFAGRGAMHARGRGQGGSGVADNGTEFDTNGPE